MKSASEPTALLEIGVEELPARFICPALSQLKGLMTTFLENSGVDFASIETLGTPRRLTVSISGIAPKARDRREEVIGPPPKVAREAQGRWTDVARRFAKAQNVSLNQLEIKETAKGERVVVLRHLKGRKTPQILKTLFPETIEKINFPKTMVWESSRFRFARPLRWILALYNSQVIRFRLAGLQSDRSTMGLLALGGEKISIARPQKYRSILQGRCVIVDPKDRRDKISHQLEMISKKVKGLAVVSPDHLEEVVQLTEYPVGLLGAFDESYLKLPREVLVSVLKIHQKFFPIETSKGKLTPYFIGIRNGPSEQQEIVRDGYQRVVKARLEDAAFFYQQDLKKPLEDAVARLKGVGFHEKLGTLWDKTERVRTLANRVGREILMDEKSLGEADRIAYLAKADLLTQMVGEFPELQGVAGRFYASVTEPQAVAIGIEQHYWPLTAEGRLPTLPAGALVALADKMDSLAALFSVGVISSGSADPYGLKRAAVGVIRLLIDNKWPPSLLRLIDFSFQGLPAPFRENDRAREKLGDFFHQRLAQWFGHQGFRFDEVEAVLSHPDHCLSVIHAKLKSLKLIRGRREFDSLSVAIKRARNILKQAQEKGILPTRLNFEVSNEDGETENSLYAVVTEIKPRLEEALKHQRFEEALLQLAPLREPVDAFFEKVMVMVDDENARAKRLSLLMLVKELFDSVVDFSKLQVSSP